MDARKISWGVVAESWQAVFLGLAVDMLPCPHLAARARVLGLGHPQRVEGRGGDNHRGALVRFKPSAFFPECALSFFSRINGHGEQTGMFGDIPDDDDDGGGEVPARPSATKSRVFVLLLVSVIWLSY